MDKTLSKIEQTKVIAALWRRNILHWKLDSNQMEMYDFIRNSEQESLVISCARQSGKSFFIFTVASEFALQNPGTNVIIVAPKLKQIKRIAKGRMSDIWKDCPSKEMQPKYKLNEHVYEFPNGSSIFLAGTDGENYDSIRGITAHMCIVDEAGFCTNLNHIINSILLPTMTTTAGKLILSSTPPDSLDHDFIGIMNEAQENGSFILKTIYDNPRLTAEDIEKIARRSGGFDSADFLREYMCQLITNPEMAIVPEFNEVKNEIVQKWPRPKFYDSYTAMDIGGTDLTVLLFAYYDFRNDKIVIEDELVVRKQEHVTDYIASECRRKEESLWIGANSAGPKPVYLRVSDNNNKILINDLAIKHQLYFNLTDKDDNMAAINNMRMLIKQKRVIINPKCVTLLDHLENGIWNKTKTSYARSKDKGHFDAIEALKYLCRNIDFHRNPYPEMYAGGDDAFLLPEVKKPRSDMEKGFENMFKMGIRKKNGRY